MIVQGPTGINTVTTWMDYTLPDNIQNLSVSGDGLYAAGNSLDNIISVGATNNMQLYGAGGNNVLVGGAGTDTFIVDGTTGSNAIYGWHTGDQVRLLGGAFTSFAQVQAAMTQQGSDVILQNGQNNVVIRNTTIAQFQAADFQLALDHSKLGTLTFDDEFNSLSLRSASNPGGTWTPNYWYGGVGAYTLAGNGELQLYTAPGFTGTGTADLGLNPFSVSGGVLDIHAQKVSAAQSAAMWNYGYSSGVITTHDSFAQTYGYFEMRAELPTDVSGAWPAFWLVPADGSWPPELDVMETLSGTPNLDYTSVHSAATGTNTAVGVGDLVIHPGGYHTYGVLWTPTELTYYLDGQQVFQTATPADMNKPMYMIANMAVGGWAGTPDFTSTDMKIDYIRAYALTDGSSTWTSSVTPNTPDPTDPTGNPSTAAPAGASSAGSAAATTTQTTGSSSTTTTAGSTPSTTTTTTTPADPTATTTTTPATTTTTTTTGGATTTPTTAVTAVSVADASYTAPAGVTSITLTGSWQTVHGNDAGDTFIVADNTGNALYGGAGNDVFQMGRGGDWVTGGGGSNTYVFGSTPWVGAHITDFNPAHDAIDLSGLLAQSNYHGASPIADGYIKITADASGNAQVWSDLDQIAHAGWWLVVTLDGVSPSRLTMQGDIVTGLPVVNPAVSVSDPNYTAPTGVTSITLTGSWQTIHGNDAGDTFIVANGTGNALYGGAGNDTFIMGRNGDWASGGGGANTYVFQATPWASGGITDFHTGDKIDLTGLLANAGYTGSDPVGAGVIKVTDDGHGDAQVWSNVNAAWWLVTTLEHEPVSNLHVNGAYITG